MRRKKSVAYLMYVLRTAWKESNRRLFTGQGLTYIEDISIAKEDILQRERTFNIFVQAIRADLD
jgi:hypothetical protein